MNNLVNFITNKYFNNNFTFMRRTREFHTTVFRIELLFLVQQNCGDEMFIREQERVLLFCFNYFVDGVVHKFIGVERQSLCWENGKWFDEGTWCSKAKSASTCRKDPFQLKICRTS
jgi:hypothetical protein